jgi:MFS transporter, DHA1 family, inner membrane transport protein
VHAVWSVAAIAFLIGGGGGLSTILQTRLIEVAGEAQSMAAALNQSAFNIANSLGPWLGGLAITAGFGLPSVGWVGALLTFGGLVLWGIATRISPTKA